LSEPIKSSRKDREEHSLEAKLRRLETYRKKAPKFRRAIAQFGQAEAPVKDPLEGKPFEESLDTPSVSGAKQTAQVLGA